MWPAILAGVGGSILGGILNNNAQNKATDANTQVNRENQELQKEFAQQGLRWKVADAKAAGINPLVALGAQTASFSPASIGSTPNTSMGDTMSNIGQDVSRAMSATRTSDERTIAQLNVQGAQLDLQGKALDNQIKQSQLRKMEAVGPAFPGTDSFIPGQGNSGRAITEKNMERTKTLKGSPHAEPGAIADLGWAKTKTGVVPIPSGDVKQRIEDNMPQEFSHFWRNNVAPNWGGGSKPPKSALPKGATHWEWSHSSQEFQPYHPKYKFEKRWHD